MELWTYSLLAQTARASLVFVLAWAITRAALRQSASTRHTIWAAAFVVVLVLPVVNTVLPAWRVAVLPSAAVEPVRMADDFAAPAVRMPESTKVAAVPGPPARPTPHQNGALTGTQASGTLPRWTPLGAALFGWFVIAAFITLRYLVSLGAVAWMKQRTAPLTDQRWRDAADIAAATLGLARFPDLLISSRTNVPFTCGILRPALVVPSSALDWTEDRIQVVCLHELGHIGRHDCLIQAITQLVCAFYWFNPLAWMGARRLRAERERACDDLVIEAGTRGSDYAAHLLEIARAAVEVRPRLATAAIAMARPSELEGRLLAILDPRLDRAGSRRRAIWQVVAAAALVALPIATLQLVAREAPSPVQTAAVMMAAGADATAVVTANASVKWQGGSKVSNAAERTTRRSSHEAAVESDSEAEEERGAESEANEDGGRETISEGVEDAGEGRRQLSPAALEALRGALSDPDAEVRKTAMQALSRYRSPATYDVFMAGLKDADPEVRELSVAALSQMRETRAADALILALKDESPDVREQAAFALGQIRAAQAVSALLAALNDLDDDVREQALHALMEINDKSAVPAVIAALSADKSADVREQAAFGLGRLGDKAAIQPLIAALRDSAAEVRSHAAFALSEIGDGTAVEALTAAIKDADAEVRQHAIFAISRIAERGE